VIRCLFMLVRVARDRNDNQFCNWRGDHACSE
jgi:hypothetical protein